ncbi:MAG: 50S ribosomal protein L11 methyltransferase [Pseudomonadota bacterium]
MSWLQVTLSAAGRHSEELADACLAAGAISAVVRGASQTVEQVWEPAPGALNVWERAAIFGYWPMSEQNIEAVGELRSLLNDSGVIEDFSVEIVAEIDPAPGLAQPLADLTFGAGRLRLVPNSTPAADIDALEADGVAVLRLDPGLAFGSGLHPTTQLCLEFLSRTLRKGDRVLDYGCGSGVLALASLQLGAGAAVGVDYDPQALLASRNNADSNGVADRFVALAPDEWPTTGPGTEPFDLVMANILANPLIELAPRLQALLRPGGSLVLAGLLAEQASAVMAAYPHIEFTAPTEHDNRSDGVWVRLDGVRSAEDGA